MSTNPQLHFSDTDKLLHLSLLLKAMDDLDGELTKFKADYKARREALEDELRRLRWEVLSGQERLPLEPVIERVAEQINAGALNRDGVTCTAEVRHAPDEESTVEEKARTRKTKDKLKGQDALIEMPKPRVSE